MIPLSLSAQHKRFSTLNSALLTVFLLLALISSGLFSPLACLAEPVILDKAPSVELAGHLERYDDLSGKKTFADILNPKISSGFKQLKGSLNDGYSHKAVWLRFTMLRTSQFPSVSWLRLYPPYIDYVTAYILTGNNPASPSSYEQFHLGDHIPVAERPVVDPDFLIPLSLPLEKPVTVYIRVQSISSLTFAAAVYSQAEMIYQTNTNILIQGGYLAITFVIILLNLLFFLRIRDMLFLLFTFYALSVFINYLSISGILSLILPGSVHLLSDYLADLGKGGGILIFSVFLMRLFASVLTPPLRWYLVLIALLGGILTLSNPLGYYIEVAPVLSIAILTLFFVIIWLSFKAVKNKQPAGSLFFVAFSVSNFGYFLHFLKLLGWVSVDWWNINNIQYASLINMIIMTFALTERLRISEKRALFEAQASEQKAVELAKEMTVELRQNEKRLEKALASERLSVERKSRFLAMLSHEYRTPLAIIRTNLDIFEIKGTDLPSWTKSKLQRMKHAVTRLVEVMDVSLDCNRLADYHEKEAFKNLQIGPFINAELENIRSLYPERSFVSSGVKDCYEISGESRYLKTALFNILDNARKYSPPDSPITVDIEKEHSEIVIKVRNQGPHISPDDAEHFFEKYHRGINSADTAGAGVGLWLVRQIIEHHRGRITIESCTVGVVTTIHLPLVNAPATG
ncbi:MAG: sensor histidine kinase [Chlorobium sp.]|nr:sensor histidine kinase [Chlorobium sp.]